MFTDEEMVENEDAIQKTLKEVVNKDKSYKNLDELKEALKKALKNLKQQKTRGRYSTLMKYLILTSMTGTLCSADLASKVSASRSQASSLRHWQIDMFRNSLKHFDKQYPEVVDVATVRARLDELTPGILEEKPESLARLWS